MSTQHNKIQDLKALVADNQLLTQKGIVSLLKETNYFNEIDIALSKDELLDHLSKKKYNLLIIDFEYLDINELDDIKQIIQNFPETRILIISDNKDKETILKLKKFSINNYILKSCDTDEFVDAVNSAISNRKFFSEEILDILIDSSTPQKSTEKVKLTTSETEIVRLISQGLTTKEIAVKKFISQHTVITHRKNIFRKVGVNSTSELIMYAIRAGIVDTLEYYI
jgi:DNA-binding NarL/FixJ family response regulator